MKNTELTDLERTQKNRLNKIHKLKNENRTLSSRRKYLVFEVKRSQNIYLTSCCEAIITGREFKGLRDSSLRMINSDIEKLIKISEKIGRNGLKIERLRLMIKQSGV